MLLPEKETTHAMSDRLIVLLQVVQQQIMQSDMLMVHVVASP